MKRIGRWWRVVAALCFLVPNAAPAQQAPARASGIIAAGDNAISLELRTAGDTAVLFAILPDGHSIPYRRIDTVDDAVAMLADQRLAFAWPTLLAWAGPDLTALRDRAVAKAAQAEELGLVITAPRSTAALYSGDQGVTATLHYASTLVSSGMVDQGLALLRRRIAKARGADATQHRDGFATQLLTVRLANILFSHGDEAGGMAMLDALAKDATIAPTYRLNIDVQLAVFEAETGRSAEALALITASLKAYRGEKLPDDSEVIHVPDSEANFAWVEACALDGLNRHDEARARMAQIAPRSDRGPLSSTTQKARLWGFQCMRDAAALGREIAAQLATAPPGSEIFARLQPLDPPRRIDQETLRRALAEPILVANLPGKARLLPPALQPAVAGWRGIGLDAGSAHR